MSNQNAQDEDAVARGVSPGSPAGPRTAAQDAGSARDLSDEAMVKRIFARYYDHIEDLGIPDSDRRCQLALDLGYLLGIAMRSLKRTP